MFSCRMYIKLLSSSPSCLYFLRSSLPHPFLFSSLFVSSFSLLIRVCWAKIGYWRRVGKAESSPSLLFLPPYLVPFTFPSSYYSLLPPPYTFLDLQGHSKLQHMWGGGANISFGPFKRIDFGTFFWSILWAPLYELFGKMVRIVRRFI